MFPLLCCLPYPTVPVSYATSIIGTGNALFHLFSFFYLQCHTLFAVLSPVLCPSPVLFLTCSLSNFLFSVLSPVLCPIPCYVSYRYLLVSTSSICLVPCSLSSISPVIFPFSCFICYIPFYLSYLLLSVLNPGLCPIPCSLSHSLQFVLFLVLCPIPRSLSYPLFSVLFPVIGPIPCHLSCPCYLSFPLFCLNTGIRYV